MQTSMFNTLSQEVRETSRIWRYLLYRSYVQRKIEFRKSAIGFFIEPIMLIISTFCIALLWNKLFGRGGGREFSEFFLYVLVSFGIWNLISGIVVSTANCFAKRTKLITRMDEPFLGYLLIDVYSQFLLFCLSLPAIFIILIILGEPSLLGGLYFLYGICLIGVTGVGIGLILGACSLVWRDLKSIITSLMRVMFLLTPIIWQLDRLGDYKKYIYWNPFYNYLAICRDGLLVQRPGNLELQIATIMTICTLVLGLLILAKNKVRLKERAFRT